MSLDYKESYIAAKLNMFSPNEENIGNLLVDLAPYLTITELEKVTNLPARQIKTLLKAKGIDTLIDNKQKQAPIVVWMPRILYDKVDLVNLTYKKVNKITKIKGKQNGNDS